MSWLAFVILAVPLISMTGIRAQTTPMVPMAKDISSTIVKPQPKNISSPSVVVQNKTKTSHAAIVPTVIANITAVMPTATAAVANHTAVMPTATAVVANHTAVMPTAAANQTAVMPTAAANHTAVMPTGAANHTAVMPTGAANHTAVMPTGAANHTAVMPTGTAHVIFSKSIVPVHHSSTSSSSASITPHPTHPGKIIQYECGKECQSLKKRLWAAGAFAIIFAVLCLVLVVLLYRQYRIAKDSNDPALSRLI